MHVWPFYAGLATAACLSAWREEDVRPVGIALMLSFAGSNAAQWLSVLERPAAYTVCEVMVLSMAFLAHVCGAGRLMVAVVAVSTVSIGTNIYATTFDHLTRDQIVSWELATNLCFAAECLLVATAGVYDRARHWLGHGRPGASLHGRTAHSSETIR